MVVPHGGAGTTDPRLSASARFDLARASYLLGDFTAAARLCAELAQETPDDFRYITCSGLVAAHRRQRVSALRAAARLSILRRPYDRGQTTYARAQLAAALGDTAEALSLLRQSLREGVFYGTALHSEPELAPLRSLPAFQALLVARD